VKETLYCTKYVLTHGVVKFEGEVDRKFAYTINEGSGCAKLWLGPREWFRTLEEAQVDAKRRLGNAVASAHRKWQKTLEDQSRAERHGVPLCLFDVKEGILDPPPVEDLKCCYEETE
jgi:hypothetical protein